MTIARDGTWLASGSYDGTARIWDTATGRQLAALGRHKAAVTAVATAPDGRWIATGAADGTVRIWDANDRRLMADLTGYGYSRVTGIAIAPDSSWLAISWQSGRLRLWDVDAGQERTSPDPVLTSGHKALAVAADGSWIALSPGFSYPEYPIPVQVWDAAAGQRMTGLTGHTEDVHAAAVAPDGTWMATAGNDGTIRVWATATIGCREEYRYAHISAVKTIASTADGSWLAADSGADPHGSASASGTWLPGTGGSSRSTWFSAWPLRPTAPGWQPAISTRRCGSGMWPQAS